METILCRHIEEDTVSKGVQCDKAFFFFFHKCEHNGVGAALHSSKIPTEAHLIDVIALHPEVNNPSATVVSFSFQRPPNPFMQTYWAQQLKK